MGETKPGIALADRLRERSTMARAKFRAAMLDFDSSWEESTFPHNRIVKAAPPSKVDRALVVLVVVLGGLLAGVLSWLYA